MMNTEKLVNCFTVALGVEKVIVVDELQYNTIPEWDSIAHMTLVAELESEFEVMFDTDHIIDMSSVAKAKDILTTLGIAF